ncbi:MAG: 4-hydroxy-tetrahydrodipicolinate synthase [Verrucomicrobiota bacterium]
MMRGTMFTGCYTALVTPFTKSGAVDEARLNALVEAQIRGGVDGLVPCGTTGESPTLNHEEHNRVIELVVKFAAKRCQVIAGTGSNSTQEAIELTVHAKAAGADASLQVSPYYNKPTQAGLYAHFRAIAEAADIPMILYNIPGRCGVDIANETVAKLRKDLPKQIVGLKEATGVVDRASQVRAVVDRDFSILSGDDSLTLPIMAVGGQGVISVASNIVPREVTALTHAALKGDFAEAGRIHAKLFPLFKDLFIETNPVPIKAALAMAGQIEESYRLPMVPMSAGNQAQLRKTLAALGLVK